MRFLFKACQDGTNREVTLLDFENEVTGDPSGKAFVNAVRWHRPKEIILLE